MSVWQFEPPRLETESINNGLTKSETIQWRTRCERSTAPPTPANSSLPRHAPTVWTFFSQKAEYKIHTSLFLCSLSLSLRPPLPIDFDKLVSFVHVLFLYIFLLWLLWSRLSMWHSIEQGFIFILSYCLHVLSPLPSLFTCFLCPRCALNQMTISAADFLPRILKFNQRTISRSVTSHNNNNTNNSNSNNCAVQWCSLWCMSEELMLRLSHPHTHTSIWCAQHCK